MSGAGFVTQACRLFLEHWRKLRFDGLVPHTRFFLDRAPVDHIPFVFICELTPGGVLIRHMGTGLVDYLGRELTGKLLTGGTDYFEPEGFAQCIYIACAHPCGLRQVGYAATADGGTARFEGLALPLAVDPSKPARFVAFSRFITSRNRWKGEGGVTEWIDIGAGIPNMPPRCGNRHILESLQREEQGA